MTRARPETSTQGVGGVALEGQHAAEGKRSGDESAHDSRTAVFGEESKDRKIVENAAFAHTATSLARRRITQSL
jgi:hypothetical protein